MNNYSNINEAKKIAPSLPAIYAIKHYPSVYIGCTTNLKRRMIEHSYQFENRPEKQAGLSAMLNEYGVDNCNVEVLYNNMDDLSKVELNEKEAALMQLMADKGYNVVSSHNILNTGAKNNFFGQNHTKKVREKASRKVRVETPGFGIEFDSVEAAATGCNISPAYIIQKIKGGEKNCVRWTYSTEKILTV